MFICKWPDCATEVEEMIENTEDSLKQNKWNRVQTYLLLLCFSQHLSSSSQSLNISYISLWLVLCPDYTSQSSWDNLHFMMLTGLSQTLFFRDVELKFTLAMVFLFFVFVLSQLGWKQIATLKLHNVLRFKAGYWKLFDDISKMQ